MTLNKSLTDLTDEQLIKEFQTSNTIDAYEILVKRYKDPLMNFVYRFVGDRDICTDIVQDTMIKFYLNKDSYREFAKFSTWIYTIAGNLARTEYQRKRRRNFFSISSFGEEDKSFDIPDNSNRPDIATDMNLKNEIIQKALLKVRDTYREAVILRDVQELSYEEIAEIMKIEVGTVKSRINRGRAELQKYLKDIYND